MSDYGSPVLLEKNIPVNFPDFTIEYLGERQVEVPVYVHKYFTYHDYKITHDNTEQVVSWTSGTGELSPLTFEVSGIKYSFQPWGIDHQTRQVSLVRL